MTASACADGLRVRADRAPVGAVPDTLGLVARKKKVNVGGNLVDGTEVGFRPSGEHWNEYLLDDGTLVRIKLVVTEVVRIDDAYDSNGEPVYVVNSTNVMRVSAPDELRRQPDGLG